MSGLVIPHFGLARQYKNIGEELLDATHRALKDGKLVGGHYTRSFEEWLKKKGKLGGQHKVPRLMNDRSIIEDLIAAKE